MRVALALLIIASTSLLVVGCMLRPPRPNSIATRDRIATMPAADLRNRAPLTIHWSEHQVPFIEAQDDADVPYAMGLIHAHLRLGQMEILRLISQGRLAQAAGPIPFVVDIDHALRVINFGKASPAIEHAMRADTRDWLSRYVEGINDYLTRTRKRPLEFRVAGLDDQPWTVQDVITVGRLAGTDINWGALVTHLMMSDNPHWPAIRERMRIYHDAASPSFGPASPLPAIQLTTSVGKTGSNSFVVAGSRTPSGQPLLANDPHVGFTLPALWCAVGYKSPSYHVTGLTIPGVPFVVLGRNQHIAWGGTNMQGISTSLFDITSLDASTFTSRTVTINRRFWFPASRRVRESELGPIVTDLAALSGWQGPPLALRWRGHDPSDEFSAFKDASHAHSFDQFRAAFAPFAVSGQNFLYADTQGNIGQVMAIEYQPAAGAAGLGPIARADDPAMQWQPGIPSTQLPFAFNPPEGLLVSTNNTPARLHPPVVLAGNWNDRQDRITQLLQERPVDRARAGEIQRDVYSASSHALAQAIITRARALTPAPSAPAAALLTQLSIWDGTFAADSRGALVFTSITRQLAQRHYTRRYDAAIADYLLDTSALAKLLEEDVTSGAADADLPAALADAAAQTPQGTWGDVHRLRYAHWFGLLPVIGSWYTFGEQPVAGSLQTVFKSAGPITTDKHFARYGANARQIIDLAHPDEHYIAMVGGQDGWFGSENFLDMTSAWHTGNLIRLPMTLDAVRRDAIATTQLP
jgi:penicillin G amidase